MKYRVDYFLPRAFEAINRVKIGESQFLQYKEVNAETYEYISKEYIAYVSSLGANIVQSGVKAALKFYEVEESESKSDKRLVNAAINFIMKYPDPLPDEYSNFSLSAQLPAGTNEQDIQEKAFEILDAATALKLALRTFNTK